MYGIQSFVLYTRRGYTIYKILFECIMTLNVYHTRRCKCVFFNFHSTLHYISCTGNSARLKSRITSSQTASTRMSDVTFVRYDGYRNVGIPYSTRICVLNGTVACDVFTPSTKQITVFIY